MAFKILNENIIDDSRNILNALAVGIGTTNPPTSKLWVEGDGYFAGVTTASRFVSNVSQGTAPISVASSTLVTNLNANFLNGFTGAYYQVANNLTGAAPGSVITQSSGLTITGNLSVSGNVSVSGTSFLVSAQQLRITDRDITLGITTDANGNDISTDATANHGGIAIASTEGSPILNIPIQAGINTDPSTYKQLMWIRQNNYSGMGTDAWVFNYGVSIGNTASVQNLSRLTVGAGFTFYDTYLDALDIRARNITAVNNINATGIITSGGVNVTSGNDYKINGASVLSSTTLGSVVVNSSLTSVGTLGKLVVTGVTTSGGVNVTTGNSYQINGTSVLTSTTLGSAVVNSSLTSVGTLGILNVTGVTTSGGVNVTTGNDYKINGTSVLNSTTLGSAVVNSSLTSVGTLPTLNATNITNTNINSSGIHTAATFSVGVTTVISTVSSQIRLAGIATIDATTKATLERELAFAPNDFDSLNVSGISTLRTTTLIGGGTSTGTANQVLQVTGISSGAYIGGNLGIGTTNPTSKLDVLGDVKVTGVTTSGGVNVTTGNDYKINNTSVLTSTTLGSAVVNSSLTSVGTLGVLSVTGVTTSGGVNVTTGNDYKINGTSVLTSTTLGSAVVNSSLTSVGILGQINVSGISTHQSTTLIGGGTSTGTAGQVLQVTGISSGVYIGGNLGIGITNPSQPLDVNGNVRFRSGIYDVNNTVGAANSVLTANGSGGWSWQPVVSGGGGAISGINVTQDDTGIRYPLLASGANATTTAQYVDATALVYNTSSNCLGIGSLTPTSRLDIIGDVKVVGIVTASDFNSSSDIKLKTNIQRIANPIEKVLQINGVSFNWKESGKATMGVIAQEVEVVLPELVSDTDPKSVNYNGLIGLLIECVKDQQRQIDELRNMT